MIISPEAQKALLDLVLNATNSTVSASQSASPQSPPNENNPSSGFGPTGNEIYYAIGALALAMTAGLVYFVKTMDRKERKKPPVIYSDMGMPVNSNLGGNSSAVSTNNSDYNNNNNYQK